MHHQVAGHLNPSGDYLERTWSTRHHGTLANDRPETPPTRNPEPQTIRTPDQPTTAQNETPPRDATEARNEPDPTQRNSIPLTQSCQRMLRTASPQPRRQRPAPQPAPQPDPRSSRKASHAASTPSGRSARPASPGRARHGSSRRSTACRPRHFQRPYLKWTSAPRYVRRRQQRSGKQSGAHARTCM